MLLAYSAFVFVPPSPTPFCFRSRYVFVCMLSVTRHVHMLAKINMKIAITLYTFCFLRLDVISQTLLLLIFGNIYIFL